VHGHAFLIHWLVIQHSTARYVPPCMHTRTNRMLLTCHASHGHTRFPTAEFRTLALNVIGKLAEIDRGLWNRFKVQLCGLLLLLADEERPALEALEALHKELRRSNSPVKAQQQHQQEAQPTAIMQPSVASISSTLGAASRASRQQQHAAPPSPPSPSPSSPHQHQPPDVSTSAPPPSSSSSSPPSPSSRLPSTSKPYTPACLAFLRQLDSVVDLCLDRDRQNMLKLMADERISDDQKSTIRGKFESRQRLLSHSVSEHPPSLPPVSSSRLPLAGIWFTHNAHHKRRHISPILRLNCSARHVQTIREVFPPFPLLPPSLF
jgi:hypothetical protein